MYATTTAAVLSFQPDSVRVAVLIGGFARCHVFALPEHSLAISLAAWCEALHAQAKFPMSVISKCVAQWCGKTWAAQGADIAYSVVRCIQGLFKCAATAFDEALHVSGVLFRIGWLRLETLSKRFAYFK
ncbi:unnamed protein product [Polarella glacialis]|uniref:Uncharacterized protein n=1 Tax=Polarella glacialis TaxID=89957 RepID=A0A813E3K5_POLGL|nr:unnamed protein product [Polarella glacialis]